jgi:type VI protein secretion system component Hcp
MAVAYYLILVDKTNTFYPGEGTTDVSVLDPFNGAKYTAPLPIQDYSFGYSSTAGKISISALSMMRNPDALSPQLLTMCATDSPLLRVDVLAVNLGTAGVTPSTPLRPFWGVSFNNNAMIDSVQVSGSSEAPEESIDFSATRYVSVGYASADSKGTLGTFHYKTWDLAKEAAGPSA